MLSASDIRTVLGRHPRVRLAFVFGSAASGRATAASDLDLAVAARSPLPVAERLALIGDLAVAGGQPVDLVDLQNCTGLIVREAICGGTLILNDDPALYAQLMLAVMHDDADFRPYRERLLAQRRQAWLGR